MSQIKIACLGDIMCGDSFYALGTGVASSFSKYGINFLDSDIRELLTSHDIVICNIESCLSDINRKEKSLRSLHMRGFPKAADYLACWGINVANLANNHILEHGIKCALDTVSNLKRSKINVIGAGRQSRFEHGISAAELTIKNRTFSILSICLLKEKYAYSGGAELEKIIDQVKARTRKGHFVIVSLHWGTELIDRPSHNQKKIASDLTSAGAKLIIGHHPHVPQGIEQNNGTLTAYSLGNFIFDSFFEQTKWSFILTLETDGKEIIHHNYIPFITDSNHRPRLVNGEQKKQLLAEISRRSQLLKNDMNLPAYQKAYESDFKKLDRSARKNMYRQLTKTTKNYKPAYKAQLLLRPIKRRLGLW